MAAWLALVVLIASGVLLVGRHDAFIVAGLDAASLAMAASGLILVVWLGGALLPHLRDTHPRMRRAILRGGIVALLLGTTVWLQEPLSHAAGSVWSAWGRALPLPPAVAETIAQWSGAAPSPTESAPGERAVRIRKRPDGQFHVAAILNGTPAALLVDSGAATVVLKAADARNAGIDMSQLSFSVPVETAQGTAYAARVRLRRVQVGIIALDDVEALVAQPGHLETSLLGSSFLNRLRSYEFSGAFLTFRG